MIDDTDWQKSTRSGQTGSCVEMRHYSGDVQVRDSKAHGQGPILTLGETPARAWLEAAKRGELDDLV